MGIYDFSHTDQKMNQDTRQRAYFDRFAEQFRAADYLSPDLATRTELASFFHFLDLPPDAHVLEVGCGTGRYALPLLIQGYTVTGVDVSPNSLRLLQSLAERAGVADRLVTVESALERPLFEAEFDAAFGINILHHVTNMPAFCTNVVSAVRPGGCIAFMEPNPYNPFFYPAYVLNGTWHLEKGFLRCSPAKLRALFTHLGLRNVEIRRYSLIPTRLARLWPGVLNLNTTLIRSLRLRRLAAFTQVRGEKP